MHAEAQHQIVLLSAGSPKRAAMGGGLEEIAVVDQIHETPEPEGDPGDRWGEWARRSPAPAGNEHRARESIVWGITKLFLGTPASRGAPRDLAPTLRPFSVSK